MDKRSKRGASASQADTDGNGSCDTTAVAVEASLAEQKRTFETLLDVQLKAFQACVTTMIDSTNTRIDSFLWIRHISNVVRFCMLAFNCLIYCFLYMYAV